MRCQLIDADSVQIKKGSAQWLRDFRNNKIKCIGLAGVQTFDKRQKMKGCTYIVRLWCKTEYGASMCIVVPDIFSTEYRKMVEASEELSNAVHLELASLAGDGSLIQTSIIYKKTTRGFEFDPKTNESKKYPWLCISTTNAFLKSKINQCIAKVQTSLNINVMSTTSGESRVDLHTELLEKINVQPEIGRAHV